MQLVDVVALLVALAYMQSVLTAAHHTGMWIHDGTTHIVESPSVVGLLIGLGLVAYSLYKNRKFSTLLIIALTIFATASIFWLSGLRTNFYG